MSSAPAPLWLGTNHRHIRISPQIAGCVTGLGEMGCKFLSNRLARQAWIRYRINLDSLVADPAAPDITLVPITSTFIEHLSRSSSRDKPQVRTAIKLWQHGLHGGYVWIKDNKAMCFQWLFSHHDNQLLRRLPNWAGMYPPLPGKWGQLENILTLPAGMRYPGGAAGPFARAMYRLAAEQGFKWLITHIHERNTAARRWAQRTGWSAYGRIHRYQIDLPLIRDRPLYLHDTDAPQDTLPMPQAYNGSPSCQGMADNE